MVVWLQLSLDRNRAAVAVASYALSISGVALSDLGSDRAMTDADARKHLDVGPDPYK